MRSGAWWFKHLQDPRVRLQSHGRIDNPLENSLGKHVRGHLSVELDKNGRLARVLVTGELGTLRLEFLVGLGDLLASPIDRVDFLSVQTKLAELVRRALLLRNVAHDRGLVRFGVGIFRLGEVLLLVLRNLLRGELEDLGLGAFELVARLGAAVEEVWKLLQVADGSRPSVRRRMRFKRQEMSLPSEPNALGAAGQDTAEAVYRRLVEELLRDAGDEDRLRLREVRVLAGHEEVLAQHNVAGVLALQEVEHPEREQPAQDEVGGVTRLLRFADVAESEPSQAGVGSARAGGVNGEENDPGHDPAAERSPRLSALFPAAEAVEGDSQGEEDLEHQKEESDKDVGIEAVLLEDCPRGRAYDMRYPSEEGVRERLDLFAARTGFPSQLPLSSRLF